MVASEFRTLAQGSSDSGSEITAMIGESTSSVEQSVSMVAEAMVAVAKIAISIEIISEQTSEAAKAVEQRATDLSGISAAIGGLDRAQKNAAMSQEVHASSCEMRNDATSLETSIARFVSGSLRGHSAVEATQGDDAAAA